MMDWILYFSKFGGKRFDDNSRLAISGCQWVDTWQPAIIEIVQW